MHLFLISDDQISDVSQQSLASALEGNKSQDLHLSLRLSVSEGVKVMYNNYQNKKWSQVRILAIVFPQHQSLYETHCYDNRRDAQAKL